MEAFLQEGKAFITEGNLEALIELYTEQSKENYAWEYVYQKLYLHACLKKKRDIVEWLKSLFPQFDPIQQIALRQMFSYGKYLLAK